MLLAHPLGSLHSPLTSPTTPPTPAAYFVFLGMLAVVACVEPAAARYFSDWWSEHELEIRVPKLPLVLKVGGAGARWAGRKGVLWLVESCLAMCCCSGSRCPSCRWCSR